MLSKISLLYIGLGLSMSPVLAQSPFSPQEVKAMRSQAKRIDIIKDTYGVPHVYAKTDADAVFGMMYVQCEEFFDKVENSLITRTGRLSEVEGEAALLRDLWSKLFIDSTQAKAYYQQSPEWLRKLCDAHAAGINYYLATHPAVKPKLITRVEPWMNLMNNVPAMGGSNVAEADFKALYLNDTHAKIGRAHV